MKTIKLLLFSTTVVLFATTGCIEDFTIRGNGMLATEKRMTLDFDEVSSEGAFEVHITNGNEYDVIVNAESNILPYIETNVDNGKLRIYIRGIHNVNNRLPMEINITTPALNSVIQSGSGVVTTGYFSSPNFKATLSGSGRLEANVDAFAVDGILSGSGNMHLSGSADNADFLVSGSGRIDANELNVRDCDARISGSGNMWVSVDRYLKASISGSGNVFYSGEPLIDKIISGSGNVISEN